MFKRIIGKGKQFLLWSQKYTRTDMLYLFKGGFWLTLGQIVSSGLVLLVTILAANYLPKDTYGTYKYVLSIVGILMITTLPQMASAVSQAAARGYDGAVLSTLKAKMKWGSLGSLVSLGLATYYAWKGNSPLAGSFLIVAAFLPFFAAAAQYDALLLGRRLFHASVKYSTILNLITTTALITAIFYGRDAVVMLLVYFASRTAVSIILFLRTLKSIKPNRLEDPGAESYGKHMTLMGAISTVANYLDGVLVYHFLGAASVAVYAISIGPPNQIKGLISSLDTMLFPNFAKRGEADIRSGMNRKFLNLFVLGVLVVGAYILAAPYLFKLVFPQYGESVLYSQIFALSMLNMTFFPAVTYLKAKKMIREQYLANVYSSVFQIVVMIVCIMKWGLLGLVLARVAARYVGMLINLYYYYRTRGDSEPVSPLPVAAS